MDCCLQLIVPPSCPPRTLRAAIEGGVDLVQLRSKGQGTAARVAAFRELHSVAKECGIRALVNDDIEAARALGADGVHLGQADGDPDLARGVLGPQAWIGWSTHGPDEVERAAATVTHFGLGACYATATKADARPLSEGRLRAALARSSRPVFAIGGIDAPRLPALLAMGVRRIAVSSAILNAADPRRAAQGLRELLDAAQPPDNPESP